MCVIDPATGDLADLGLDIPNQITYHTFAAERSFWNERYASATLRRHRTIEVGYDSPDPLGFSGPNLARVFRRFGPGGARQKRQLTGEFSRRQVFESR
ncbi:hypothetical protein, partial [Burkholderia gladioli]|uniref:hypothetical protein n=1 Tax=Burkholderia gladioli TaxID=28095 RepID=UPI001ABB71BB